MAARQILSQLDFCQDIKQREKTFGQKHRLSLVRRKNEDRALGYLTQMI